MVKLKKKQRKFVIQFAQYAVSGGAYFWVGYFILNYLYYQAHWSLWWATIVSNLIGWTVNFLLQRYWAFNNQSLKGHQTTVSFRYGVITVTDFILNYFILYGLNKVGITPAIGQFVSSAFFTVWNYLWYRFWVFPETFSKKRVHTLRLAHRPHGHSAFRRA
jgi:putative flippase GtrA